MVKQGPDCLGGNRAEDQGLAASLGNRLSGIRRGFLGLAEQERTWQWLCYAYSYASLSGSIPNKIPALPVLRPAVSSDSCGVSRIC